jgi:hypothetical protein
MKNIKTRCNNANHFSYQYCGNRGIKCLITTDELKELWVRDKAYEMVSPSIDRIDNNGNYTFENCRFIEIGLNSGKDKEKAILQYDLNGNFMKEWESTKKASVFYHLHDGNIWKCLNGKRNHTGGYKWQYKNSQSLGEL